MPVSILLGGMEVLFFRWHGVKAEACVGFFVVVPLLGSLMSRQRVLTMGLAAGAVMAGLIYAGCRQSISVPPPPGASAPITR